MLSMDMTDAELEKLLEDTKQKSKDLDRKFSTAMKNLLKGL
ncbi:MAG: hypothetical protein ABIF10_01235 [Candidatus Woesearchaeota archaeon]